VRRLIINADDFGLTPGVNRAIVEAHEHGIVTSATLMANEPAFTGAAQLALSVPSLSVGCHVVLVDGSPLLGASQIATLIESRNGTRFHKGLGGFALRAFTGSLDPEQIEAEVTAQVRKLQSAGIEVSHLDTHKHTHIFPSVLRPLLRAAQACGIKALRNPFGPVRLAHFAGHPRQWKRWAQVRALSSLTGRFQQSAKDAGMVSPDGTIGIVATGVLGERLFRVMVENLPDGTWELVCHPGYNDADLQSAGTRLRESRAEELKLLTSLMARDILERCGVEPLSYRQLK
jgi:hopanoid biosynthesis associated protein HpnK